MQESPASRVYRELTAALAHAVEPGRQQPLSGPTAWDVEDLVRVFLPVAQPLRARWRSTVVRIMAGQVSDPEAVRQEWDALTRGLLEAFRALRDKAQEAERQTGLAIDNLPDLRAAIAGLEQLREEALGHWPVFGAEEFAKAEAAIARGESIPVEEAFARAAGISQEELLRRVEAHKQRRTRNGA